MHASEAQPIDFRRLFEEAPNAMAVVACDGRWLQVNHALCQLVGYREDELVTRGGAPALHAYDLAGGSQRLRRLVAGEIGDFAYECRHQRRDGSTVWMRASSILVSDAGGKPLHVVLQAEDVTQAKALEEELAREQRRLEESQEAGRIGSWELDLETGAQRWSSEQFAIYGVDPSGPPPGLDRLLALVHPDDRQTMLESMRANMESGATFTDEYRVVHPTLGTRTLVVRGRYLQRDPHDARPARLAGTTLDVTAEREAQAARWDLAEQLRLFATIVMQSDDAIVVGSPDGLITQWNDGALRIYGYTAQEAIGQPVSFLTPAGREDRYCELLRRALAGDSTRLQTQHQCKDGWIIHVSLTFAPIVGPDGKILGVSSVARDITAETQAQEALLNRERQLYDAQALAHVGSWDRAVSAERAILSAELCRILGQPFGFSPTEDEFLTHVHVDDKPKVRQALRDAHAGFTGDYEFRIVRPNGEIRYLHQLGNPHRDSEGKVTRLFAAIQDITERKRYEAELQRLATHDELTGLANRRTFDERIAHEIARAKRHGHGLSLALMDVDHFKRINDTLGHPVGDRVLAQVARAMRSMVREHELIARVGGEEFAWILAEADAAGALAAVRRGLAAVAASRETGAPQLTLSGGICSLSDGMDATELYRRADNALLAAKQAGRDRVFVYDGAFDLQSRAAAGARPPAGRA